jgi:hypothetical protein
MASRLGNYFQDEDRQPDVQRDRPLRGGAVTLMATSAGQAAQQRQMTAAKVYKVDLQN